MISVRRLPFQWKLRVLPGFRWELSVLHAIKEFNWVLAEHFVGIFSLFSNINIFLLLATWILESTDKKEISTFSQELMATKNCLPDSVASDDEHAMVDTIDWNGYMRRNDTHQRSVLCHEYIIRRSKVNFLSSNSADFWTEWWCNCFRNQVTEFWSHMVVKCIFSLFRLTIFKLLVSP